MKNPVRRIAAALAIALTFGGFALAQDQQPISGVTGQRPQGKSRIEVGLAFAQTLGSSTFNSSQTFRVYAEDGSFNGSYKVKGAPGGGLDLQYNLNENLGVRLGAQSFSRKSTGTFEARVPHPFFFTRPRSITGTASNLGFSETAYSLTAVYRGGSGRWNLSIEGGPAYFSVDATVADKASYTEIYPYDALAFDGIVSSKRKVSPFGFALGLEVGRELTSAVSVVAQGRFTQGTGTIDINGAKTTIKAGGAQARVGLRLVLARKRAGG